MIAFVQTKKGLDVFIKNVAHPVPSDHPNFKKIKDMCLDTSKTPEDVLPLIDLKSTITKIGDHLTLENDILKFKGRDLPTSLNIRLLELLKNSEDISSFYKFLENLFENPSARAVQELYDFLEACELPITSDGYFLAYKKVKWNYKDIHSKTFDNSIGQKVSMSRNEVDDNSEKTCSFGLHCCSFGYLPHYGTTGMTEGDDRVVIVKVDPRNVVSIPKDYNNQKMRVCEYEVVDELPNDGMTELVKWCIGKRSEGWIRDTLATLRKMIADERGLGITEFTFKTVLNDRDLSDARLNNFLDAVISNFQLKNVTAGDYWQIDNVVTLQSLLQFVSNYTF